MSEPRPRPLVLCILDGWGHRTEAAGNAIRGGKTPVWDRLIEECPNTLLATSGPAVGLPDGQMGNSEVGHMNLGSGRVVIQDLPRIDRAVGDGTLGTIPALTGFVEKIRATGGTVHLLGLLSPGGVHSHQNQMVGLARVLSEQGVSVAVHAFLDGRDTPPRSGGGFLGQFQRQVGALDGVFVATVAGRYYAMDRDTRWDRVEKAYAALVDATGRRSVSADGAISGSYDEDVGDEFVVPTVVGTYAGMKDGDGILMANFRADRAREILTALLDPDFDGFDRLRVADFAGALGMVSYSVELDKFLPAIFPPQRLANVLGAVVSNAGLKQLRVAETEKYAHVTFFFNGGEEEQYSGEDRILIPSPRVATYDLKPEMSAYEITDRLVGEIEAGTFDIIVVNYANGDMVGHTGDYDAAVKAVEVVDTCLGRLERAVITAGGTLLITADHGNCEQMRDAETGDAHTAHTTGPVPFVVVGAPKSITKLTEGRLCDVAPTVLGLMGLPQPAEMTGRSLFLHEKPREAAA